MRQFLADYSTIAFRLLFRPKPKQNQTYRNQRILLDGGKWEGCKFIGCKLAYRAAGGLSLTGCTFGEGTIFFLEGRAARTLGFMQKLVDSIADGESKRRIIEETFSLPPLDPTAPPSPRLVKDEGDAA